jgi:hypothetical protein
MGGQKYRERGKSRGNGKVGGAEKGEGQKGMVGRKKGRSRGKRARKEGRAEQMERHRRDRTEMREGAKKRERARAGKGSEWGWTKMSSTSHVHSVLLSTVSFVRIGHVKGILLVYGMYSPPFPPPCDPHRVRVRIATFLLHTAPFTMLHFLNSATVICHFFFSPPHTHNFPSFSLCEEGEKQVLFF